MGFEPTNPEIMALETTPLDRSGMCARSLTGIAPVELGSLMSINDELHTVGFEPTHPKITVLKTAPLDHSGMYA